jgi:acetyltransferase-like isoleucine patch superfamily enzyme
MRKKNIACEELVAGKNVKIDNNVIIKGEKIIIGDNTNIRSGTRIDVKEYFKIGKNSIIGENSIIKGRNIEVGREFYTNHHIEIGGGSCFEKTSSLKCGYWCHLGSYSIINTAMPVKIGNEVGLGRFTNLYTHGAYLSTINGFPVKFAPITIGNQVWIPSATINPGVTIGNNVVIGVNSIITKDIPSGSLAFGNPCKVIEENYYPQKLSFEEKEKRLESIFNTWKIKYQKISELKYLINNVDFNFKNMKIVGKISIESERIRNILRRNGIRFKVETDHEYYEPWK